MEEEKELLIFDQKSIYLVEVKDDRIKEVLTRLIYGLEEKYGRARDYLVGIALGPNSFQSFKHFAMEMQMVQVDMDKYEFMGVRLFASPYPGIIPLFNEKGWYIAHAEVHKFLDTSWMDA